MLKNRTKLKQYKLLSKIKILRLEQEGKNPVSETWMQLLLNEDRIMTERAGLFLLTSSILMASYVGSYVADIYWLRFLLPIIGLVFSSFWFYVEQRSRMSLNFFWKKILKAEAKPFLHAEEKIFTLTAAERNGYNPFWRMKARVILSFVLPLGWFVVWFLVLRLGIGFI